jgi:hypothetical protein
MRAYDFYSKFGFNTNLNAGDSPSLTQTELTYLGVYNIRDSIWGGTDYPQASVWGAMLAAFAAAGKTLRLHLGYQGAASTPSYPMASWLSELKSQIVVPYPNALVGVAGPNEPDNQGFTYTDGTGGPLGWQGIVGANKAQAALYAGMKADPVLKAIPVDMWPQAFSYSGNDAGYFDTIGNQTAFCDRNNVHDYYGPDNFNQPTYPTNGNIQVALQTYLGNSRSYCNRTDFVTTETGWSTPWQSGAPIYSSVTNEYVQARLILNDLFDHAILPYNRGVYIYKLHGGSTDLSNPYYGVFHDDGTPKLAGVAIHNLMTIINDPGGTAQTFDPGRLNYALAGMPAGNGSVLLQKSTGSFLILLWNETPIWNASTGARISIPSSTVTVSLPFGSSGSVYDPTKGATPISTFSNVSQLEVMLNDSPLIIQVQ